MTCSPTPDRAASPAKTVPYVRPNSNPGHPDPPSACRTSSNQSGREKPCKQAPRSADTAREPQSSCPNSGTNSLFVAHSSPNRRLIPAQLPAEKWGVCRVLLPWRDPDSNWGHHDFQSCALPTELSRLALPDATDSAAALARRPAGPRVRQGREDRLDLAAPRLEPGRQDDA